MARAKLRDAEGSVANLEEKLRTDLAEAIRTFNRTGIPLQSKLRWEPASRMEYADKFIRKMVGKLMRDYSDRMEYANHFTARLGFPPQTLEDARYANATGDYLGAMSQDYGGRNGTPKPCPPDETGNQTWCLDDEKPPTLPGGSPPSLPPAPPGSPPAPPQNPTGGSQGPAPPSQPGSPPSQPPSLPPTGGVPQPPGGDGAGNGNGDEVPPIPPPECPPNCRPFWHPDGYWLCIDLLGNICGSGEPPTEPPPGEPEPPEEPQPPGPDRPQKPQMPNPETCKYDPEPPTMISCGSTPPPPKPASPYWLVTECDGCGWKWCIWKGDTPPIAKEGQTVHGPFGAPPDPRPYTQGICKVVVGEPGEEEPEPEEPEEKPGEEKPPEEPGEEKPPEEPDDKPPEEPKPPERPEPETTKECKWISRVLRNNAGKEIDLCKALKIGQGNGKGKFAPELPDWLKKLSPILGLADPTVSGIATKLCGWLKSLLTDLIKETNCNVETYPPIAALQAAANAVDKWFGVIPPQVTTGLLQLSNSSCQSKLPNGDEADSARLKGDINLETWECYQKAEGNRLEDAEKIYKSKRTKLNPAEVDWLYRRKYIQRPEWVRLMRENGVIEEQDRLNIHNFNDVWPPLADVIRMMVRDVADDNAVRKFGLSQHFIDKWKGKLKEFGYALGITDEIAEYYWRAHWDHPSYTQLTHMVHRLRPGRVRQDLVTTKEDVKYALEINDMLPYWTQRLIEITYHPVNPSDSVKAFYIFAYSEDDLRDDLLDNGYSEESANKYITFLKKDREVRIRKQSGLPTARQLVTLYSRCLIPQAEFSQLVDKIAISKEQSDMIREAGETMESIRRRERGVKAIKKPFMLGLIDEGQANEALVNLPMDSDCVNSLVAQWQGERVKRDKYLTASTLCKMRERNIIDGAQQVIALIRQGWSREDATRITQLCTGEINERTARQAEAQARRAAAQAEKAQKQAEKLRRLAECGPPACPKNTPGGSRPEAGQSSSPPNQSGNGVPTTR